MSIFKEIPPTAGFKFEISDLFGFRLDKIGRSLEEDFKSYLGIGYAKVICSGTAALYVILESLKDLSAKKTVIIPSYTCPLAPLAIKKANLNIEVCDINKNDFNFDKEALEDICSQDKDILAIIAVHLAGIPLDIDFVKGVAQKNKIFLVEDCAQSLGAEHNGRKTGVFGDFSFFSMARGKGLTIYEGGVIGANNAEYAKKAEEKFAALVKASFFDEALKLFELLGYWIFYRPFLFWFVFRLPELFWKWRKNPDRAAAEEYVLDFPVHRVSAIRKFLGRLSFWRISGEIEKQRLKAAAYIEGLKGCGVVKPIEERIADKASYPYIVLLFDSAETKNKALIKFKGSGLGVSEVYISAICDYDYLKRFVPQRNCANARNLAKRQATLSTNIYIRAKDQRKIIDSIRQIN